VTTTIAFTGHRPKDLEGATYMQFRDALDALGTSVRTDLRFVVGGALGVDHWAALYARDHSIPYTIILPFPPEVMGKFWGEADRRALLSDIDHSEELQIVNHIVYDVRGYNKRNEWMVNMAQVVFAVWTGKRTGGTANCIRYAKEQGVPVWNLWPLDGKLHRVK